MVTITENSSPSKTGFEGHLSYVRTFINWLIGVFVIVIISVIVILPALIGGGRYVVMSGSMQPTINTGDIVITTAIKPTEINLFDIIVFENHGVETVHRVISINTGNNANSLEIITRGDDNNTLDGVIDNKTIKGKVAFTIAGGGILYDWVKANFIVIAIIIALWLFVNWYLDRRLLKRQKGVKND